MTSIPNVLKERLGIGETFCLAIEESERGDLRATHPNPHSDYGVVVTEGLDLLDERPPEGPIEVKILGTFVDGDLAGEVIGTECDEVDNR